LKIAVYAHALHEDWPDLTAISLRGIAKSERVAVILADSISPLLASDDPLVRELAARAIGVGGPAVRRARIVSALQRVAADRDSSARVAAIDALAHIEAKRP
jgi:hypothetical protein